MIEISDTNTKRAILLKNCKKVMKNFFKNCFLFCKCFLQSANYLEPKISAYFFSGTEICVIFARQMEENQLTQVRK